MNFHETIVKLWAAYCPAIIGLGKKLLFAAIIVAAGKIVIRFSRHLAERAARGKLKTDETFALLVREVIHYGIVILCLIMILDVFGVNTAGLIALLGAAGVAIGFALKDTLGNIAAGIVLLVLRPFRVGDFIECGAILGSVCEVGLFTTIMETADGIFISAPNSNFWGIPLKNFSRSVKRRMDISVTISYSDSIDSAFQVLRNIVNAESRFLKEPAPQFLVQSLGEYGTGITLRAWVPGDMYLAVLSEQMKNVKEKIQEAGLTIAVPKREIHITKGPRDVPEAKEISG